MSSAVAMNRKITSHGGRPMEDQASTLQQVPQRPQMSGTSAQQQWQILNYHETRLNKMDAFLTQHSKENAHGFNNTNNILGILDSNIKQLGVYLDELKEEMNTLKSAQNKSDGKHDVKHTAKSSKNNNKKGSVQLELEK